MGDVENGGCRDVARWKREIERLKSARNCRPTRQENCGVSGVGRDGSEKNPKEKENKTEIFPEERRKLWRHQCQCLEPHRVVSRLQQMMKVVNCERRFWQARERSGPSHASCYGAPSAAQHAGPGCWPIRPRRHAWAVRDPHKKSVAGVNRARKHGPPDFDFWPGLLASVSQVRDFWIGS